MGYVRSDLCEYHLTKYGRVTSRVTPNDGSILLILLKQILQIFHSSGNFSFNGRYQIVVKGGEESRDKICKYEAVEVEVGTGRFSLSVWRL